MKKNGAHPSQQSGRHRPGDRNLHLTVPLMATKKPR